MVTLYLNNEKMELGESFSCPVTKTFENLENPSQIVNDYSKTITIPHVANNDKIFGHLFNPDRVIAFSEGSLTGIYFDPFVKIPFRLEYADDILMTGYLKVLSVNDKGYQCSLNGEEGYIFQEMKKLTFDNKKYTSRDDISKYWIDGGQYFNEKINKTLIFDTWNIPRTDKYGLRKVFDLQYNPWNIIGFVPKNSFSDNFDYKSFQTDYNKTRTFTEVLKEGTFEKNTKVSADTVIGNGLKPRDIGEFRARLQVPFIYWNKFWMIMQEHTEQLTGYKWDYQGDFFESPLFTDLAMRLKSLDQDIFKSKNNWYKFNTTTPILYWTLFEYQQRNEKSTDISIKNNDFYEEEEIAILPSINNYSNFKLKKEVIAKILSNFRIENPLGSTFNLGPSVYLTAKLNFTNENGVVISRDTIICDKNFQIPKDLENYFRLKTVVRVDKSKQVKVGEDEQGNPIYREAIPVNLEDYFVIEQDFGNNCRATLSYFWTDYKITPIEDEDGAIEPPGSSNQSVIQIVPEQSQLDLHVIDKGTSSATLNDFWNNEHSPFDILLNYCRQMRIIIDTDDINKKLIFRQQADYFKDYKVLDFNNKIDKSKEYTITPVSWDTKYVLFNYENTGTAIENEYRKKYKFNIGEKNIITNYNFNENTKSLFNDIHHDNICTDAVLSWTSLYDKQEIVYTTPYEWSLDTAGENNKYKDNFSSLFFVNRAEFDINENLRIVYISDDTYMQLFTQKFVYTQSIGEFSIGTTTYLRPELVNDKNQCCLFELPKENYTTNDKYFENNGAQSKSLYNLFWERYIFERYSARNKKITCYLRLTPTDFSNFKYSNFITIDNQLYFVNKIYDYDITNNEPTKVDLITVQDIKGYTTNQFKK